jgi:hypothetical protein
MDRDFAEMLSALSEAGAEYLVVGAHALAAHGLPRATGDLGIWIRPTATNAVGVRQALKRFGAPLHELRQEDPTTPDLVFQIGIVPARIDLLTSITGVSFEEAWPGRLVVRVAGLEVSTIGRNELIRNKRAVGRPRDLADVAELEGDSAGSRP